MMEMEFLLSPHLRIVWTLCLSFKKKAGEPTYQMIIPVFHFITLQQQMDLSLLFYHFLCFTSFFFFVK